VPLDELYSAFRNIVRRTEIFVNGRVLCVGIAVLDNIFAIDEFPDHPTKVFARSFAQVGGGPAANAAVTVARLGGRATLFARVGDDAVGHSSLEDLRSHGVDVQAVRNVPGHRTGVSAIMVDKAGERMIVTFSDPQLDRDASWLPLENVAGHDAVLADVRWPAAAERVLSTARQLGIQSVLDADLSNDDSVERLMPLASHVVFSRPALLKLTGIEDPDAALRLAAGRTSGSVSVTLGGDGFRWLEAGQIHSMPAFDVDVVDTLGAGDVFHGAFALAVAQGFDIGGAGRFASAAAALKCTVWGGRSGIPTRDTLDRFMALRLVESR